MVGSLNFLVGLDQTRPEWVRTVGVGFFVRLWLMTIGLFGFSREVVVHVVGAWLGLRGRN